MKFEDIYTEYKVSYILEYDELPTTGKIWIHNSTVNIRKELAKQIRLNGSQRGRSVNVLEYSKLSN